MKTMPPGFKRRRLPDGTLTGNLSSAVRLASRAMCSSLRGLVAFWLFTVFCGTAAAAPELDQGAGFTGFNMGARSSTPLRQSDYGALAGYGANLVRQGVKVERCRSCTSYEFSPGEIAWARQTVEMGRIYGFRVVLTLSPEPGGEQAEYWDRPDLQASLVDIWTSLAAMFKNDPVIAGYDLLNEPVIPAHRTRPLLTLISPGLSAAGAAQAEPVVDPWRALASSMIAAIRAVDANALIIFEPSPWGLPKGFRGLTPLPFQRVVYSFHFYEPQSLTHQGLYNHRRVLNYPDVALTKDTLAREMEPARLFAQRHSVPMYVGEFGIVRWAPGNSAFNYLNDVIELFNAQGWNWTYHAFREYEGWDAELQNVPPQGYGGSRSAEASTIRLLVDKGFKYNPQAVPERRSAPQPPRR